MKSRPESADLKPIGTFETDFFFPKKRENYKICILIWSIYMLILFYWILVSFIFQRIVQ